jgi:signal transduction histidine kinase
MKSVQSIHQCKSVIQTSYDIVKAHGGEIYVTTKENEGLPAGEAGTTLTIQLPL